MNRVLLKVGPALALWLAAGCGNSGQTSDDEGECLGETGQVEALDGVWDGTEDWRDPGASENDSVEGACGWDSTQTAHHCFSTAVHAIHMHTGEILMFHGERDQRVWKIGTPPEAVEWHPNLLQVQNPLATAPGRPDMFCAGHVQLADGRVFTAGGNIDGQPATGGLFDTFIFDPVGAVSATNGPASACSFGWLGIPTDDGRLESPTRRMSHDRWYPTLTVLRDGRVLIAGGYSWIEGLERASEVDLETCQPGSLGCTCTNSPDEPCVSNYSCMPDNICRSALLSTLLEVYDPVANTFDPLTGARFPIANFPVYPQMFLLPNGDVFYAGSEEAGNKAAATGRFLTIDYDAPPTEWTWHPTKEVESEVTGGSAVMYAPGKILKTGGPQLTGNGVSRAASDRAERIDLSGLTESGNYDSVPDQFEAAAPMHHARHFHNLVALPNGKVLAVGGNSYYNGQAALGENPKFPCEVDTEPSGDGDGDSMQRVDEIPCEGGCPSICVDLGSYYDQNQECGVRDERFGCSLLSLVECETDEECESVLLGSECTSGRCSKPCSTDEQCGTLANQCAPGIESPLYPGRCNPGNNACYGSKNAEIYDPECDVWEESPPEQYPRMYHSTALLMPDGRVLSMGGGHRGAVADQPISEYFAPRYSTVDGASRPSISFGSPGGVSTGDKPLLSYGGTLDVQGTMRGGSISRFTLIKLGSTTHGFDQDQRFLELSFTPSNGIYSVQGPKNANEAPPGYYMLFAISSLGEPSVGQYVRVGAN